MGKELFDEVVRLSGLPEDIISKELTRILKKSGIPPQKVTEPVLRKAMASYLREIVSENLREESR
ncbi:MAG: hypothetical protein A2Z91_03120 [Deltaproteobacteria bacterium GWA2_38_16]|nr:MAG: hypothetical protein A2Z91_03120 [Deltaproteobacteria bacterium GWA2_38_16]OGQ02877.1 MAG: hypothetical protein A3D19_06545 [Deltaproteobacteria bacterium RIFCSPHIGHO2_02_FULL_38_15]OGQ35106.1 MAG: hypothetical protein A3A72_03640 [Deltaproteobacteria bacterium RIFCSPLOWO2_01_FULL_38_9]OGQ63678.1 MAG: hypothetical protein A3G92_00325 [Deltaproteobacteria bacterium RIFCSPLOWO2_12_FULL_38_8]HBQ21723.1 hypothetical protein [Deltaproteobacteria bacterium]